MTWLCPPGQQMSLTTAAPALFPLWLGGTGHSVLIPYLLLAVSSSDAMSQLLGAQWPQDLLAFWKNKTLLTIGLSILSSPSPPRPRPPRHSSLVRWDLFNDLF